MKKWTVLAVAILLMLQAGAAAASGSLLWASSTDGWALDWSVVFGPVGLGTWQQGGSVGQVSVYEVEATAGAGLFHIGVGHRWWEASDSGTEWYLHGGVTVPLGVARVGTDVTYSETGVAYKVSGSLVIPVIGTDMLLTAAYQDWRRDGWQPWLYLGVGEEF